MTDQDYHYLDLLLAKLSKELPGHRWGLFPYYMMDCPNITCFTATGERIDSFTKPTIKDCVEAFKEDTQE